MLGQHDLEEGVTLRHTGTVLLFPICAIGVSYLNTPDFETVASLNQVNSIRPRKVFNSVLMTLTTKYDRT